MTGTLRRSTPSTSIDSFGDADTTTYTEHSMKGIVDTYSDMYKKQAGIPDTDVKLLVLGASLSIVPQKDDQIKFRSTWYKVRMVKTDPALAAYEMQSFEIPDPTV